MREEMRMFKDRRSRLVLSLSLAFCMAFVFRTSARTWRDSQIPNGPKFSCATCHDLVADPLYRVRNGFGVNVGGFVDPGSMDPFWGLDLADMDGDGDTYKNGLELQDPQGVWDGVQYPYGDLDRVSNPGDADSTPPPEPTSTPAPPTETPILQPTPTPDADFNGDGVVDAKDLLYFMRRWHQPQ
jgi:hypothetical protein